MIAIVGGGTAGWSAAEALLQLGYDGELCLFGAESVAPYERPVLSKAFLTDDSLDLPPALALGASRARDISFELGARVVSLEPRSRVLETSTGRRVTYDRLLLATGAVPRRLEIPGAELRGVHYLRELGDARLLRDALSSSEHVAVIGGGVLGLEVASAASARGADVTVIEAASYVMARIAPPAFARVVEDLHRARGITLRAGLMPVALEPSGDHVSGVTLEDGTFVPADTVVISVGVVPRTELASAAGIAVRNGIVVDEYFRTGDPGVFAAGDVASAYHVGERRHVRMEQWRPAQEQGRRAAAALLDAGEPYGDMPWMWSDQHDFHIQMVGFGFEGTEVIRRGDLSQRQGVCYLGIRGGRLVAACGISLGTGIARTIRTAEQLMQLGPAVSADMLRDPAHDLRALTRSARPARGAPSPSTTG
jgi:3-phenylpropionate/trans-cinnamate dioxygenase ferredoxin reductase component